MARNIEEGDVVRCVHGSIDRNLGAGETGRVSGFARLSKYHAREIYITFAPDHQHGAWFWEHDIEATA